MRTLARPLVAAAVVAVLAACGSPPVETLTPAAGLDAAAVLAAFDAGDSAASVAGDEAGLRAHETEPSLLFSLAAARAAAAAGRPQPGFRHVTPRFATPGPPGCFFVVAGLQVDGDELPRTHALHFVGGDGAAGEGEPWQLSHSVVLGEEGTPAQRTVTEAVARSVEDLPAERRDALATGVFERSVGRPPAGPGAVEPGQLVDGRLAGALQIHRQELATTGATSERTLTAARWAPCTARTAAGLLAFLELEVRDTMTAAPGEVVTLAAQNPDMVATGHPQGLSAPVLTVDRVEVFLLAVPDDPAAGATVLGFNDTAVTAAAAG